MNAVLRLPINRSQRSIPVAVPPPVGGWNLRDALAAMPPEDAVRLDNWFPGFGSCKTRGGSAAYANTLGGAARMLAEFNAGSNRKFLSAANGNIWDISAAGAGVSLGSGFASNDWEWAQFDDSSGGARMGLVNGVSAPQTYNGTALAAMTISGTGLTPANLNGIHIFKGRSYFWDDRTQDFWYSATNALGGALTRFPLGRVQGTGGNLVTMATWSRDAGNGMQDLAAFILSSGDVLVYDGDDPGTAANWRLAGRYSMAAPIGKRCATKLGADLIIGTKAGYISLATVFAQGRLNEDVASVSSKIRPAVLDATRSFAANFGWDMKHYPAGNYLLVNIPTSTSEFQQHVMNTATRAWCRFMGQNALCWGLFRDELYYGTAAGTVLRADSGVQDNGVVVTANAQTAWNYFGDRSRKKRATALQLAFKHEGSAFSYIAGLGFDFREILTTINQSVPASGGATWPAWESNPWDTQTWGAEGQIINKLSSASGHGYCASLALTIANTVQRLEWLASTYLLEPGGV